MRNQSLRKYFPRLMLLLLFLIVGCLIELYFLINAHSYQVAGKLIAHVQTQEKVMALTFDDGPSARTPEILKILAAEDVKATFFLVGSQIEKHPDWAQAILAAGHEIGNHSYTHQRMVFKSREFYAEEVEKTDALIHKLGFQGKILFRPPYGKKLFGLPFYLAKTQRTTLMWDLEPEYWPAKRTDPERLIQETLQNIHPGSVLLLHPMGNYSKSFEALPKLLKALKTEGWKMVTARELLKRGSASP